MRRNIDKGCRMSIYQDISKVISEADALLITASNGLSITEGLHLFADNEVFRNVFGDFRRKYGLRNLLHGFFYYWPSSEEKWGFLSRAVNYFSGSYHGSDVMTDLKDIIGEKDYFVLTSNIESHFELAGFDENKIYEVEGNWLYFRCSEHCEETLQPALEYMKELAKEEHNGVIPTERIPRCSRCGAELEFYNGQPVHPPVLRSWQSFLKNYHGKKLVILELGIGSRNQLIKGPVMGLVAAEPNASYITINLGDLYVPDNITKKSYPLNGYINQELKKIKEAMGR